MTANAATITTDARAPIEGLHIKYLFPTAAIFPISRRCFSLRNHSNVFGKHQTIHKRMISFRIPYGLPKFPSAPASLDALCRRLEIDLSAREKHGALLDCRLLAEVYLELIGGRQQGLSLGGGEAAADGKKQVPFAGDENEPDARPSSARPPRPHAPGEEEQAAHKEMRKLLDNPLWNQ